MTIGLPRAGNYFCYQKFLEVFFAELGVETIISPPTNRNILEAGLKLAPSMVCYPVKIYAGHIAWLNQNSPAKGLGVRGVKKCDKIAVVSVVDRLISNRPKWQTEYGCPYWISGYDMFKAGSSDLSLLKIELRREDGRVVILNREAVADELDVNLVSVENAERNASAAARAKHSKPVPQDNSIAVIARSYVLWDDIANLGIINTLKESGYNIVTNCVALDENPENIKQHWMYANYEMTAIDYYNRQSGVRGILYLTPFSCGPDSQMVQYVHNNIKPQKPFSVITVDESSGDAGVRTRVEAFIDLIERE